MARLLYEVQATIEDAAADAAWERWIVDEHIAEVIAAGAEGGRLVRLDGAAGSYVVQYEFADRAALDCYLRDEAPRLREAGRARFGEGTVMYSRRIGEIVE